MIRLGDTLDPLLARPLSIYGYRRVEEWVSLEFLYRVVGRGTQRLAMMKRGDSVRFMGPLGRGFHVPETARRIVIIAGGMGVVPLTYLAASCQAQV
ncbi:MAG: hypothetical protein N2Z74_09510, partial [Syntrophales bacterium]|nr:hypothetical protein [Syntrophales bacterium]